MDDGMSLQFIFGNSGSGKSNYLYEWVLKQAAENPKQNYLVLVPEQFTMQTQRELVRLQKAHAIMNVDVLSFARLAYRVFDELGKQDLVVLEETGKNLVLRKIAEEKKASLKVLGGNMNKMGYIGEVKSLISELAQYNIEPQDLEAFLQNDKINETLRLKLQDILVMYQGFREYLEGRFVTSEEVLSLLCDVAGESAILKNSVVVFDEFTGFTPIQNKLIKRLMTLSEQLVFSITMDIREDFYHCRGQQELFAMSKKTVELLLKMAEETSIPVSDPVILEGAEEKRYRNAKELFFMEQNLFRPAFKKWDKKAEALRLAALRNPREELFFAAKEIVRLVREEGFCYKDIAVVTGDVNLYASYVPEIFEQYEIPFFIDQTKNILFHPLTEFIRAALEVAEYDFSYESVFRFLRCGLCGIEDAKIDRLENYVLAKGIRGIHKWRKDWTFVNRDGSIDDMTEMNEVRKAVLNALEPLCMAFKEEGHNVKSQTYALCKMLESLEVERRLKVKEEAYQAAGEQAKAKEYSQIYRIVMDLFDKVAALLGEEQIPLKEYSDILDAGFQAAKVGVIPPGNDKVTIGDIERTRLNHVRVLFFLGVNDGVVPKAGNAGGIISQFEREKMAECKLELAPGTREKVFIQKFYLYLNMTKPSDYLYVTFSKVNSEGKALRRSYLIGTLLKMFPQNEIMEFEEEMAEAGVLTPKSSMNFFLTGLLAYKEEGKEADAQRDEKDITEQSEAQKNDAEQQPKVSRKESQRALWDALAKWYLSHTAYKDEVTKLMDAAYSYHTDEPISHAVTRALYGAVLENSVTRLEQFATCAFAHYLHYGLNLKERELLEFASVDMGNIYHDALEEFAKRIENSEYTWFDIPKEVQEQFIDESMEAAVLACKNTGAFENVRNRYLLERMKNTIRRTVWALATQVQKGRFVPSEFEVSFSRADKLDAIRFTLSDEEKMQLLGRIDRVDTYETDDKVYVKIIDYKSGNTSFSLLNLYHGLQLQLVVYLNAAMELTAKKHPGKAVEPAGIFYYHIKNPMVDGVGTESEAEIRQAVLEQLKLNGLVNAEPEVYRAMDAEFAGNSVVIPVGLKTDGSLKATSKVASTFDFKVMSNYVNQKILETGKRIYAGDIAVKPYQLSGRTGCDYCPYHTVCGFDARMPGFSYEKLQEFDSSDAIMEKLKEETAEKEQ